MHHQLETNIWAGGNISLVTKSSWGYTGPLVRWPQVPLLKTQKHSLYKSCKKEEIQEIPVTAVYVIATFS